MLGAVGRAWEMWRAKSQLLAPFLHPSPGLFYSPELEYSELRAVLQAGGPTLLPYQGLAAAWNDYTKIPDYPAFLTTLARRRGIRLDSILDLACGTGLLTEQLTHMAGEVTGLDRSEPMLAVARERFGGLPDLRFECGDFRDFSLDQKFDAAVCASNSLNYVADRTELHRVFAAVARHLQPGGLFTFDVTTEQRMREVSGLYLHAPGGGGRFAIRFTYDATQRKEVATAVLPTGLETHRRIPIEWADVAAAVEGTGLAIDDYFSDALLPPDWSHQSFRFFVLSKRV